MVASLKNPTVQYISLYAHIPKYKKYHCEGLNNYHTSWENYFIYWLAYKMVRGDFNFFL